MERNHLDTRDSDRADLTQDEFEDLEVIELPERELMTGCGGGAFLAVGISVHVNVDLLGGNCGCGCSN